MVDDYSAEVCNEIAEILDHIPKTLYDKLPDEIINYFYQNADNREKSFEYNVALPILEQPISPETKSVILFLSRIFWKEELALPPRKKDVIYAR